MLPKYLSMNKRVYISADYSKTNGDRSVIDELHKWGNDNLHKVDYCDTAQVASGSVSNNSNCRPCDLKKEFNKQINASSAVIFVIGDKTANRTAGNSCKRKTAGSLCSCTPYKQNANGSTFCKVYGLLKTSGTNDDYDEINSLSYLEHEFRQAQKKGKKIIIVYNSLIKQPSWLPSYMKVYENDAHPFWKYNAWGNKVGDYTYIKAALGYV